ncbi:MAG: AAA family ATPase [Bacteroidota bacterium]
MEKLVQKFYEKYASVQTELVRDFINEIDWSNRVIGIKGSRGVGKTTLVLQYIKQNFAPDNSVLYVSLDNLYFSDNKLYDLADTFHKKGGKLLAIDEVHKYANWTTEIKNIYDDIADLKIIFTGSSLLHLRQTKADLSRRAVVYEMPGLSFREYLHFQNNIKFPILGLEEILNNHIQLSVGIIQKIKPLAFFEAYLKYGYYPFFKESLSSYHQKLSEIILTVLEVDIPQFASIQTANIIYLKKLLRIISGSVPFKPNMNALSSRTGISLNTMKTYIGLLNNAQLLQLLYMPEKGINSLNKPEKIYLNNSNLMYNQGEDNVNIVNIRETFFFNQVNVKYNINASKEADFLVADKYTFEIGGKSKQTKQIQDVQNAYVVKDNIEIGSDNIIPLWMFGFLY